MDHLLPDHRGDGAVVNPGLRQIDLDGTDHFTDAVVVTIDVLAGVKDQPLPEQLVLSQNYPNPFNPTTSIVYQNPKHGRVVLRVFDGLGREITTLVDANQDAGSYTVSFSGVDKSTKLSSGVYFYRIEADNQVMTRKMILLQ